MLYSITYKVALLCYDYYYIASCSSNTVESRFKKNLDLRKIVATTDFLVHKLFDLGKIL